MNNSLFEKGQQTPQALDIEEVVLGAMLVDERGADAVMPIIKTSDVFYKEEHQHIFDAILELYNKNNPIDLLTVSKRLESNKKLTAIGGDFYLINLSQKVTGSAHVEFHARILIQNWMKRQFIHERCTNYTTQGINS